MSKPILLIRVPYTPDGSSAKNIKNKLKYIDDYHVIVYSDERESGFSYTILNPDNQKQIPINSIEQGS